MSQHIADLDIGKFLNPTFIDQPFIERFADTAHLYQAERVRNPRHRAFRKAAEEHVEWSIPRHFAYSSDNDVKGGGPDPAVAEIKERLIDISHFLRIFGADRLPSVGYYDIPSQDPQAASFQLHQVGAHRLRGYGVVNGVNCAPRKDERGQLKDNAGEAVYGGFLPNGTFSFGTGAHCFSLHRDAIENGEVEFFKIGVATKGSQFRSRDFWTFVGQLIAINLPDHGALFFADRQNPPSIEKRRELLRSLNFIGLHDPLDPKSIPPLQHDGQPLVLVAENHGNLKLGIRYADLLSGGIKEGDEVKVTINGNEHEATVTPAPFDLPAGKLALSPGSGRSAYELHNNGGALVEVFLVGGRAEDLFGLTAEHLRKGTTADIISCKRETIQPPATPTAGVEEPAFA